MWECYKELFNFDSPFSRKKIPRFLRTTKCKTTGEMHCLDDFATWHTQSSKNYGAPSLQSKTVWWLSIGFPPVQIIWIGFRVNIKCFTTPMGKLKVNALSQMIRMWHLVEVSCSHTSFCWKTKPIPPFFELKLPYENLLHGIGAIKKQAKQMVEKVYVDAFTISIPVLHPLPTFHPSAPN